MPPIRVLSIDDSALMRQLLTTILKSDAEIEVVGVAPDPYTAWAKIKKLKPDVLTLDVEMPKMDGLTFLERLMHMHPLPVVMVSSLTEKGCQTTMRALELGAIDFVTKPSIDVSSGTARIAEEVIAKVKIAARARLRQRSPRPPAPVAEAPTQALIRSTHKVIAFGASTGGTEALYDVLTRMPADAPGIVIVQHMPPGFTKSFAQRLDRSCKIRVSEAKDGDRILPGHALIAPGDHHMEVRRSGAQYCVKVFDAPPVNRFRPSVDVLFNSCARYLGANVTGVILTGMGYDGAQGMLAMRQAGAHTIAQDEESCVVFGMPKEAIAAGGVAQILPLDSIAGRLIYSAEVRGPLRSSERLSTLR